MKFKWPVVPLCDNQLKDIREEDILEDGLYRKCNTYRGGGGYDQFNKIWEKRKGYSIDPEQFVAQLAGCPLSCPYCYVTQDGIKGVPVLRTTEQLLEAYNATGLEVFHLMGGAPALYLQHWKELHDIAEVFHSDFLLVEHEYNKKDLIGLKGLHAVSIKEPYIYTMKQRNMMLGNLEIMLECGVAFYITFTGEPVFRPVIEANFGKEILEDSFVIDIKKYKALDNSQEV